MKIAKSILDSSGKIKIAALDHRGSLKTQLNPQNPELVTENEMKEWKKLMVELYSEYVTSVLIDPVYGKDIVGIKKDMAWLISMEKTGYRGSKIERVTELQPDWSVEKAKEMGALGVKLLLYYDPDNIDLARKQKELARRLSEECARENVDFLLEPLSYREEADRESIVIRTVEQLKDLDVSIFKLEYPGSKSACELISEMIDVPWVLLSAGMVFDRYREALLIAMESGSSGFAVGRAVWQEFGEYEGDERDRFLRETSVLRMKELVEIVDNA